MVIDLTQPATVFWTESVIRPPDRLPVGTGLDRKFPTLGEAVRFVMEDIPSAFRGNAWIAINGGSLSTDEIGDLYQSVLKGAETPKTPTIPTW